MSVLPSAAVILICIGGFQPVASSFEMSAFSSGMISAPVAPSRSVVSGATSGCENVSTTYLPSGEICTECVPLSGVSETLFLPSSPIR